MRGESTPVRSNGWYQAQIWGELGHGLGLRAIGLIGFSDIGASILAHLGLPAPDHGRSFL